MINGKLISGCLLLVLPLSFACLVSLSVSNLSAEVIKLKNGTLMEGEIQEIKEDHIILEIPNGEISVFFKDMVPQSIYEIRVQSIDPEDPQEHLVLAEYCLTNTLYALARKEFEEAVQLDKNLKEMVAQKIAILIEQESREILTRAYDLIKKEKYELALEELQVLLQKYPEGKYVEEVNKVTVFAVEAVKHKKEEETRHREMLIQQKENEKVERIEQALRDKFTLAVAVLDQARKLNSEGLRWETQSRFGRAAKAYEQAESDLFKAQELLEWVISQTQDVDLMTAAKRRLEEIKQWLITIYNNLGQLWAYRLNLREALKWLNRTLALEPHNQLAQELKLKIIDIEARRRLLDEGQK